MFLAPCKGIQDSLSFSITRYGFWILGIGFRIPIVSGIPDSLSCILDYKTHDPGFHKQSFPGFQNLDSLT